MRALILNGYSSANSGDGLLVDETITLIREALGQDVELTLLASYPDSFRYLGIKVIPSKPNKRGYSSEYLTLLRSRFRDFDVLIGVGGGYLRAGSCVEFAKMALVMGPQLVQAARSTTRSVYLPQSIGPARMGSRHLLSAFLRRIDRVWVRDERSLNEFKTAKVKRSPDLAILGLSRNTLDFDEKSPIILTVRKHRGSVPDNVYRLRTKLRVVDSFIQSTVGGNDDTDAVKSLLPRSILDRKEVLLAPTRAKVVVAMRLHAALMAIRAGHYVVHLSYERKGFGAFSDLGLSEYVHNVHDFDVDQVENLVHDLRTSPARRAAYDAAIASAENSAMAQRKSIISSIREAAGIQLV